MSINILSNQESEEGKTSRGGGAIVKERNRNEGRREGGKETAEEQSHYLPHILLCEPSMHDFSLQVLDCKSSTFIR